MRSMQPRPVLELNKYLLHFQVHNIVIFLEFYHHYTKLKSKKKKEKEIINKNG